MTLPDLRLGAEPAVWIILGECTLADLSRMRVDIFNLASRLLGQTSQPSDDIIFITNADSIQRVPATLPRPLDIIFLSPEKRHLQPGKPV